MINSLTYQRDANRELEKMWEDVYDRVVSSLRQYVGADGVLPQRYAKVAIEETQRIVSNMLVGDSEPYTVQNGKAVGVSPYAVLLLGYAYSVQSALYSESRERLEMRLPPYVVSWLRTDTSNTLYPALYAWRDPRGYDLMDRIYRANNVASNGLTRYLTYHINNGTMLTSMERDLKNIIIPNRKGLGKVVPRGVAVGFDSARLLRNEIARAHAEAVFEIAEADPYVDGIDWALSPRHPRFDICDGLATIGMSGQRLREPYAKESAPQVIRDSHVQCICQNRPATSYTKSKDDEILALFTAGLIFHNVFNRLYD